MTEFRDVLPAEFELEADGLQACPFACGAGLLLHEAFGPALKGDGIASLRGRFDGGDHAFPIHMAAGGPGLPRNPYVLFRSVEDFTDDCRREVFDGGFERVT